MSIQSEYVDIKGVHESVLETSSSSGSCIAGAVDDSFVVNTYSDANNKANFDIGNGSIILESKKKGYQAEVEFYGCGWSGVVYTGAFAPTKAYSEKIMLGDSGRVWERLIVNRKNTEDGYIDTYSMVYTNLIAVITHELQLEKERRSNLEIEVADLRSELESMRDNISGDTN